MDPAAISFDSAATVSDISECRYVITGCTDSAATNYNDDAEAENAGVPCEYPVHGCTVAANTLNFDSRATVLEGCVYQTVPQLASVSEARSKPKP